MTEGWRLGGGLCLGILPTSHAWTTRGGGREAHPRPAGSRGRPSHVAAAPAAQPRAHTAVPVSGFSLSGTPCLARALDKGHILREQNPSLVGVFHGLTPLGLFPASAALLPDRSLVPGQVTAKLPPAPGRPVGCSGEVACSREQSLGHTERAPGQPARWVLLTPATGSVPAGGPLGSQAVPQEWREPESSLQRHVCTRACACADVCACVREVRKSNPHIGTPREKRQEKERDPGGEKQITQGLRDRPALRGHQKPAARHRRPRVGRTPPWGCAAHNCLGRTDSQKRGRE